MRRDHRWLLLIILVIAVLIVTITLNTDHVKTDIAKFENSIDVDNSDLEIDWSKYPTTDINLAQGFIDITESGTYHITGSQEDAVIVISASRLDKVKLILDNVSFSHNSSPAIFCYKADELVIESIGENTISDGVYQEGYTEDEIGTIYANADLIFQGDGTLNLTGTQREAIIGKDDIKFASGTYNITASDDGIRGKDSVYITNGNLTINSVNDAIKSTNDTELTKGFVLVENGNLNLVSQKGKGIQATKTILINNGNINIDVHDDAIHSDNYLGITSGTINISAGDDGIHADRELIIDGGDTHITRAYEGLEAQVVTINNGDISLVANDDGINAGGGADRSNQNHPGADAFNTDENCTININGGNIHINSSGDGVDSNGWVYFNGGKTIIDGPTNDGNGALDSGMGIIINGGEVLAIGSSGMAEAPSNTSSVNNINIYLNSTQLANTTMKITDSAGNIIAEHTSTKQFSHITYSSDKLQFGQIYTLYLDDEEATQFTISNITTRIGNNQNNFSNER